MKKYTEKADVQQERCRALLRVLDNSKYIKTSMYSRKMIVAAGGLKTMVEGIRRCREDAGVQQVGCGALCNLGDLANNNLKIAEAGFIEAIVEGMGMHVREPRQRVLVANGLCEGQPVGEGQGVREPRQCL